VEEIRRKAASVDLPLTTDGEKQLRDLLVEAQQLAEREHAASYSLTKLLREAASGESGGEKVFHGSGGMNLLRAA